MRSATLLILALAIPLTPVAAAQTQEHIMYLHENLHIAPPRIDAREGDTLSVQVLNVGSSPHDVVFCGDAPNGGSTCDDRWAFTIQLPPGQSANITVPVKEAGTFEYYCSIPGHKQGGMKGELVVQGTGSGKSTPTPALLAVLAGLAVAALALRRRT